MKTTDGRDREWVEKHLPGWWIMKKRIENLEKVKEEVDFERTVTWFPQRRGLEEARDRR